MLNLQRKCKIKKGTTVRIGRKKIRWVPDQLANPADASLEFTFVEQWANGDIALSAYGYGLHEDPHSKVAYGNGEVWVENIKGLAILPIPQVTVNEVYAFLSDVERFPRFYIPLQNREEVLRELTIKINTSLFPLEKVIEPFIANLPVRKVVCAANKISFPAAPNGELIIAGARHFDDVMDGVYDLLEKFNIKLDLMETEQGFIDQWGNFMSRKKAMEVAKISGQPLDLRANTSNDELYSENLY